MLDDDDPTPVEIPRLPCPACRDETGRPRGAVLQPIARPGTEYAARRVTCGWCRGTLRVTRLGWMAYHAGMVAK